MTADDCNLKGPLSRLAQTARLSTQQPTATHLSVLLLSSPAPHIPQPTRPRRLPSHSRPSPPAAPPAAPHAHVVLISRRAGADPLSRSVPGGGTHHSPIPLNLVVPHPHIPPPERCSQSHRHSPHSQSCRPARDVPPSLHVDPLHLHLLGRPVHPRPHAPPAGVAEGQESVPRAECTFCILEVCGTFVDPFAVSPSPCAERVAAVLSDVQLLGHGRVAELLREKEAVLRTGGGAEGRPTAPPGQH